MVSASMSMPCSSIALMRSCIVVVSSCGPNFRPISSIASGKPTCACTSMVFTRLPFTTTWRRRCVCAFASGAKEHPVKNKPAVTAVWPRKSLRVVIGPPPSLRSVSAAQQRVQDLRKVGVVVIAAEALGAGAERADHHRLGGMPRGSPVHAGLARHHAPEAVLYRVAEVSLEDLVLEDRVAQVRVELEAREVRGEQLVERLGRGLLAE